MTKAEIVNLLGERLGYGTYLEIATPSTGFQFGAIDRGRYAVCERLLYRCQPAFEDGRAITYRTAGNDSEAAIAEMQAAGRRFDVVFVDPWHRYETSLRDLEVAVMLLAPRGTLVVHDCNPPSIDVTSRARLTQCWCGVTYWAFLDFVSAHRELDYVTVDTDYGCALVRPRAAVAGPRNHARPDAWFRWNAVSANDDEERFAVFKAFRRELLNLITVDEFLARIAA